MYQILWVLFGAVQDFDPNWYSELTLLRLMVFSIMFDTVKPGWSIVYIEGSQVIISKNIVFLSLKIDFVLANSDGSDEMPHYAVNVTYRE